MRGHKHIWKRITAEVTKSDGPYVIEMYARWRCECGEKMRNLLFRRGEEVKRG